MNLVMLPYYEFGGELERVPGAAQVPCLGCQATLTATPTSLEAAADGGGFLCRVCAEHLMPQAAELRMPEGAGEELRAAGLGRIADNDQQLLRRMQGRRGAN